MKSTFCAVVMCLCLLCSGLAQNQALSNKDVIEMVGLGLSDDLVIQKIQVAANVDFDTSVAGLKALKDAKVSDAVIKAMLTPKQGANGAPIRSVDPLTEQFKQLQNSIVTVWSEIGRGTGFIISADGLIVTNQHVVGPSEYIAVQFNPATKIEAKLLAADPQQDVAILWADISAFPSAKPAEIAEPNELNPPLIEGERVFTIGSPLNQRKILTTGVAGKIEAKVIISDININHGNSGGPLFNSVGKVVGITTFGDFTGQGGPGVSGIVRIEEAKNIIEQAKQKQGNETKPSAKLLPVEPTIPFPLEAIKTALQAEKFDARPYSFGQGDFEVSIVTPVLQYHYELDTQMRAAKEKGKRNKNAATSEQLTRPLDDLRNWAQYVGEYRPVITIRATPKLRETGGSIFLRSLAAAGGNYHVPAKLRFKTDFYKMKLKCGDKEVEPIQPGKIAHVLDTHNLFVNVTDATYEGFYIFPYDAVSNSCGKVTLELYSEKKPESANVRELNEKTVKAVFNDFESYRKVLGN